MALKANPPHHDAWYGYAEFCLFLGQEDEYRHARQALLSKFATTTDPQVAERTARACLLLSASEDELRQAAALADRALAADRAKYQWAYPFFRFVQGLAQYRQGRFDQAIATMRGDAAGVHGPAPGLVLAMVLHRSGQPSQARKALAVAVVAYDWRPHQVRDQDDWIFHVLRREAERMILPNLPAFLAGKYQPTDNDERLALLGVCQFTNRSVALARLYADAFTAAPLLARDIRFGLRFRAACAAALAGCGRGEGGASLGHQEQARWRKQAHAWLKLDLAAWARMVDSGPRAVRDLARRRLQAWRSDPDLAGLREADALKKLPVLEKKEWLALWKEVDALLDRQEKPG
jgi:serine/threonine-protein kinase